MHIGFSSERSSSRLSRHFIIAALLVAQTKVINTFRRVRYCLVLISLLILPAEAGAAEFTFLDYTHPYNLTRLFSTADDAVTTVIAELSDGSIIGGVSSGFLDPGVIDSTVSYTLTFSKAIDITQFQIAEFSNLSDGFNYVFTPNTGTAVDIADNSGSLASAVATLSPSDWTGITSMTVSYAGTANWRVGVDNITFTISPAAPDAPTGLSAAPGNGQASISFTAGADNSAALTNYKVSIDGGSTFTALSPNVTVSPITITGLTNGTSYSIGLKAVNVQGDSPASALVSVTPADIPAAPTALSASAGIGQAVISFSPGSDNGAAITNYKVSTDGGSTYTALSPSVTVSPITVTGLSNGTSYSIKLKAVNAQGDSPASGMVSVTTADLPTAPTALSATAGDRQAVLSFSAGANNGAAISNYKVSINGGSYTALSPTVNVSPITITALTNGTTYTFRLKAVNAIGDSPASALVSVTPVVAITVPYAAPAEKKNANPIADAGENITRVSDKDVVTVQLDGSGSSDVDGHITKYFWFSETGNVNNHITTSTSPLTSINLENGKTHTLLLQVTDDSGNKSNTYTQLSHVTVTLIKREAPRVPDVPQESLTGILRTDGKSTTAAISVGATADGGDSSAVLFTSEDNITLTAMIFPDAEDIGKAGELYVVINAVIDGKNTLSALNGNGDWEAWNSSLKTLPAAAVVDGLAEVEVIQVYSGKILAGEFQLYVGYSLFTEQGKPVITTNGNPFAFEVVK